MKSTVMKRSVVISGHKTSISLEEAFWSGLKEIAKRNRATLSSVVERIESSRQYGNLSSAIRLYVLEQSRTQLPAARLEVTTAGERLTPDVERRLA